ncbi:SIS domain-containing protein [Mahella australiensis]|uniref:Glutamine--fructose-6-phosphate aminotransferase [isomerizing] n=1 Tax=Mahella australiensis (strain DSM 15567 / CIP 107919 / 50-1 BON) TaxID=697281 RepID=F3ZZQ1_MAHA5|nr:SIS domain-containing protein [Mahella australiensis]AEE97898.1 Glutamine--fructose-6-phosphate transaminase (isomerizing) [Mahella australiensis 50-1 BON]
MSCMLNEIYDQPAVLQKLYNDYRSEVAKLVTELYKARNIFLIGTGSSLYACYAGAYAFTRFMNKIPIVIPSSEVSYVAETVGKEDIAIVISQSGESKETVEALDYLSKTSVWAITNSAQSTLARAASSVFCLEAGQEVSSATKTYTASLMMLYMLAACGTGDEMAKVGAIPYMVADNIEAVKGKISIWAAEFKDVADIFILGTGPNIATAKEAALMIKEKTFIPAEGESLIEFRHGPIEVVEPGTKVVLVTHNLNKINISMHYQQLSSLGADVRLVHNADLPDIGVKDIELRSTQEEAISAINMVIPFQLLAENIAVNRGLEPDTFRYINKVLNKY